MSDFSATTFITANMIGLWLAQLLTPTTSAVEHIQGMVIGVLGAFCWQFIKTQKQREAAAATGVKGADLPRLDLYTLGLAMGGAPLSVEMLLWVLHSFGGNAQSGYSFGMFLGAGAAGPQFVPAAVDY